MAHTVTSLPAFTTGIGVKNTVMLSSSQLHIPLFEEVKIKITFPAERSAALGVYVALRVVLFGEKDPLPRVVHAAFPVVLVPLSDASGLLIQTEVFAPAFTLGASEIVTTNGSETGLQLPIPVVVSVNITVPAAVSATLGV